MLVGCFFFFFFFWLLLSLGCNTISTLSLFILLFYFHSQTLLSIFAFNHFENWSTFLLSSTIIQTCIHTDRYTPKTSRVYAMLQFVLIFWLMIFTTANYMFHFAFFFFCSFNWLHQTTESIPFASNIYIIIIMSGSFRASWTEPWKITSGWNNGNMYNCKISVWNEWTECRGKVNTKSWPQKNAASYFLINCLPRQYHYQIEHVQVKCNVSHSGMCAWVSVKLWVCVSVCATYTYIFVNVKVLHK